MAPMRAAAIPTMPATPVTPCLPAPLLLEVLVAEADVVLLAVETVVVSLVAADVEAVAVAAAEVVPPMGAVDWPSISPWRVELKLPDMLVKVNLAENARAGYCD